MDPILELVAAEVDWEMVGPPSLPYARHRGTRMEVGRFFAALGRSERIHAFEAREFIEAGDQLTVLGWERATALDTGQDFESEWVHIFTVSNNKITRWRGFYNTAARYSR